MEIFSLWASYILLGVFAGVIAGLLGVGGGLIIVPILALMFSLQGFAPEHLMQIAVGTSLATIVFTSLSSARAHHKRGAVSWPVVLQLSLGILPGGWLGGVSAIWMGGAVLAGLFGVFELAVAAQLGFGKQPAPHRSLPGRTRNAAAGVVIGSVSALFGIGGGSLTVPWLVWHNLDIRHAVGTSAACGFPIALIGTLGFVAVGLGMPDLPAGSTGFVYWPAVIAVSIASVLSAPLGARLAHHLDQAKLQKVFAAFIALLGLLMLGKSLPI